jgi:hypothetical protein
MFAWSGWCDKSRGFLVITEDGKDMAARLRQAPDMRLSHFNALDNVSKPAFIRWTLYTLLARAGFNVEPLRNVINESATILAECGLPYKGDVFFSPFQQLSSDTIAKWTPELVNIIGSRATESLIEGMSDRSGPTVREHITLIFELTEQMAAVPSGTDAIINEIRAELKRTGSADATADALVAAYYERADAIILDTIRSIPIEIKSPGEETEISVKGVRQALENKVVLMSRQNYPTDAETTSLVIGFNLPNERSEVHELVEDIRKAFNIRVGVIDFRSLALLAAHTVQSGKKLHISDFHKLQGAIRV